MKRALTSIIAFAALLLFLGGCIPTQRELRMERDQEEIKRRLAEIEQSVLGRTQQRSDELRNRLDTLARQMAEHQAAIDNLRVELQSVNGRLQDLAGQNAEVRQEVSLMRDDLGLKVTALEDRLAQLENRMENLQGAPAAAAATPQADNPDAMYERGLKQILEQEQFAQGRQVLENFLERYPDHELSVNALYWIGEAYYGEKKYENAILQFQDVIQKYGDHPKAAAALLKQGMAFAALDDIKNARVIMQRLIDNYPLSEEAKKAEEKLAEWQGR